jgi:hypothetical protein
MAGTEPVDRHGFISGRRAVALTVALAAVFIVTTPVLIEAYPVNYTAPCGLDKNAPFKFVGGVPPDMPSLTAEPWTLSMKNNVRAGINAWDKVRYSDGSYIFTTTEPPGTVDWKLYSVKDLQTNSSYGGATLCQQGYIVLDFRKSNGSLLYNDSLKGIAAHEFGHAFDLLHTGYQDSWYYNSEAPTMESGCSPTQSSPIFTWPNHLGTLEDDDIAAATARVESAVNPNPSFEYGSAPGWVKSGGTWTAPSGNAGWGTRYLTHTGYQGFVYNQVTLYDPRNGVPNGKYRTALRFKEPSGQTGTLRVELFRRLGGYATLAGGAACVGQFPNDQDLNSPSYASAWTREPSMTFTVNPTTVWSSLYGSAWKAWATEGIYLKIQITNFTETTGPLVVDGTVYLDTAYIQECWSASSC